MSDRCDFSDRRGRPRGGRRATDPIADLRTHGAAFVSVSQLADYWAFHENTIIAWIKLGRLPAMRAGEYRVRTTDALALEAELYVSRRP